MNKTREVNYMLGYEIYKDEFKSLDDFKNFLKDKYHNEGCPRSCSQCDAPMVDGYTNEGGDFYCCSDKCLYILTANDFNMSIAEVKAIHKKYCDFENDGDEELDDEEYELFCDVYYTEWYDSGHFDEV